MKKTHKVNNQAAQGDVLFRRIDKLPDGVVPVKRNGDLVVAHSETGHDHVVSSPNVTMYEHPTNPLIGYLVAHEDFEVKHNRSFDTHATLKMRGGYAEVGKSVWEIRRQREHTPDGWRRVID